MQFIKPTQKELNDGLKFLTPKIVEVDKELSKIKKKLMSLEDTLE